MSGRTIWQAQDADWHLRERIVALGEEFGPAGPQVANWLECQAKKQNAGGLVKSGYRAVARGSYLQGGADEAAAIIRYMVDIGFLLELVEGEMTFVATVSAFDADQARGRASMRQADRREHNVTERDASASDAECHVPVGTGEKRTEEEKNPPTPRGADRGKVERLDGRPVRDERVQLAERALAAYNELAGQRLGAFTGRGRPSPGLRLILSALADYPVLNDPRVCRRVIELALASRWWGDGPPSPGVVFGPKIIETNLQLLEVPSVVDRSRSEADRLVAATERRLAGDAA